MNLLRPFLRSSIAAIVTTMMVAGAAFADPPTVDPPLGATTLEIREAPLFLGRGVASIAVYTGRDGDLVPIPYQVDERDHRNRWVIDGGPRPTRDRSPGILDENDAVVFMNRDLGEKLSAESLPEAERWAEVQVGQGEASLGFAYVGSFSSPPGDRSQIDYARYDPETDRIYAERYAVEFGAPLPTHVGLVDSLGELGENQLSALRLSGEVRVFGGLVSLRRGDRDLHHEFQGFRDGPVRVVRRAKYWIPLPLGFKARGRVDIAFYRDFVEGAAQAKIVIPPKLVGADGELLAYFDFTDFRGARLVAGGSEPTDPIERFLTAQQRRLAGKPTDWAGLLLPENRSFLLAVRLQGALARLDKSLYFDVESQNGGRRGGAPRFGFELTGVRNLTTGRPSFAVAAMVVDGNDPARLKENAERYLMPPPISVRPIRSPGASTGDSVGPELPAPEL